jgi:hypothetical protein
MNVVSEVIIMSKKVTIQAVQILRRRSDLVQRALDEGGYQPGELLTVEAGGHEMRCERNDDFVANLYAFYDNLPRDTQQPPREVNFLPLIQVMFATSH